MKETLRKKVITTICSPIMAMGIGLSTIAGGMAYGAISENNASSTVDKMLPHLASPKELEKAKEQILIFDRTIHSLIASGDNIDIGKISGQPELIQAITLVNKEQVRQQQRTEIAANLNKPVIRRAFAIVGGGILLMVAGYVWHSIKDEKKTRGRQNQDVYSKPKNT